MTIKTQIKDELLVIVIIVDDRLPARGGERERDVGNVCVLGIIPVNTHRERGGVYVRESLPGR